MAIGRTNAKAVSGGTPTVCDGWSRPAEWLSQPTYALGDQRVDILFAVGENAINDIAFKMKVSVGGTYSVNWGDGTSTTGIASLVNAEHMFNWSDIPNSTLMSNGMRQVMISVTVQNGNFTGFDFNQKHSLNPKTISNIVSQIMEINMVGQYFGELGIIGSNSGTLKYRYFENFNYFGANSYTTISNMFRACNALKNIQALDFTNISSISAAFYGCNSILKIPDLTYSGVINIDNAFTDCWSLTELPKILNATLGTLSGYQTFFNCFNMSGIFNYNTSAVINFSDMFEQCDSITDITLDLTSGTTFGADVLELNYNLAKLRLLNMPVGLTSIDLAQTNLDVDALVQVFNDLYDRTATTAGTIIITSAYGASGLSAAQRQIATDKNWTITG